MKVSYVTPFYNGECEGRFGRFHDWVHALRDMDDPPFEFDIHPVMAANPDESLASQPNGYLGDATELYGTKRNIIERTLETRRMYRDLRDADSDIIHLIAFDPLLIPLVASVTKGKPLVLGPNIGGWYPIRDDDVWLDGPINQMKSKGKYFFRKCTINRINYTEVLAFSDYHYRMLKHLNVRDSNITTLRPGVSNIFSPSKTQNKSSPPELLYVGELSHHKGYPLLLRALNQLDSDVHVRIVGGGDPNKELIRSLGLEECITIEGFVERVDLPEYYRNADLYIVPSIDETAGTNTQFEALASGTPVVATNTDGVNEFGPAGATRYFWPREPDILAATIDSALRDLESLTNSARSYANSFHAVRVTEQLEEIYRRLLSDRQK